MDTRRIVRIVVIAIVGGAIGAAASYVLFGPGPEIGAAVGAAVGGVVATL